MGNIVKVKDFVSRTPTGGIRIGIDDSCLVEYVADGQTRKVVGRNPTVECRAEGSVLTIEPLVANQRSAHFEPRIGLKDVIRARVIR